MKCKLIFVEHNGNKNKFYDMEVVGDKLNVEFGRVGSTPQTATYSSYHFESKKREKLRKGYEDITHLYQVEETSDLLFDNEPDVESLFKCLLNYTNTSVKKNYNFNTGSVTEKHLTLAQEQLDLIGKSSSIVNIQQACQKLFMIFPRKMGRVADYIPSNDWSTERLSKFIADEQDILDSLKGSITFNNTTNQFQLSDYSLIECSGNINVVEWSEILRLVGKSPKQAYKIVHKNEPEFNNHLSNATNKQTKLLIHGSRCQNILSIFKSGLQIRPTGAYYSGSAYGDGIYHADKLDKSLGYCGYDKDKFIMLQQVHTGKEYEYVGRNKHDKPNNFFTKNYLSGIGYDSVFAKGGNDLLNNEYIVYSSNQTVLKYLLWY